MVASRPQIEHLVQLCRATGEVHVTTACAVVNFADRLIMRGRYQVQPQLPFTARRELTGIVFGADPYSGSFVATRSAAKLREAAMPRKY